MPKRLQWWYGVLFFVLINGLNALTGAESREVLYEGYRQAPFTPPGWVFPIVWTTLNILQIWALIRVWNQPRLPHRRSLLALQAVMWAFYLLFTPLYFGLNSPVLGFSVVVGYWVSTAASIALLQRNDRRSAWLLVPLLAWLSLAFYLSAYGAGYNFDPYLGVEGFLGR